MDSNKAANSSQLSEQMNTAIPNEVHTSISADPARPADIREVLKADQTEAPAEYTTPSSQRVTAMPDPLSGSWNFGVEGKCRTPCVIKPSISSMRSVTTWV